MAAPLAVARAVVQTPGAEHTAVQVWVRGTEAVLRTQQGEVVAHRSDVATVERTSTRVSVVTFEDGTSWTVARQGGCGCGG